MQYNAISWRKNMKPCSQPVRYGKPCMTNLPPKLGRQIIQEILSSKPFDDTKLKAQNQRLLARLSKRIAQMEQDKAQ